MTGRNPGYLPPGLADGLMFELTEDQLRALGLDEGVWKIERLLETAYADGYREGYMRGRKTGYRHGTLDHKPRPGQPDTPEQD